MRSFFAFPPAVYDVRQFFARPFVESGANRWDWALLPVVLAAIVLLGWGAAQMATPYQVGEQLSISLDPIWLPYYLLRTSLRMFLALGASLVFSCLFAVAAAKSRAAEKVLVPLLDILQSIPILGFLSITVTGFIALFPGNLLGVEFAAIFAIFTSQAWNMAFSLYQSLRTVPAELREAARILQLSGWQRFWRLEIPFAMPGLLWNMMMSMSGGWFFVVASEAISVSNQSIKLPGVGSYIALAIEQRNLQAVAWAIAAMLAGILAYDQLLFRPLVAWSQKFRFETTAGATAADPWLLRLMRRTRLLNRFVDAIGDAAVALGGLRMTLGPRTQAADGRSSRLLDAAWLVVLGIILVWALTRIASFVSAELHWRDVGEALLLGSFTLVRVVVLIVLASLLWVPIGVWLGLRPIWARRAQPLAQFLAAFPANLLFPPVVLFIVHFDLSPDNRLTPLMILGTQWYILFNVVAGAAAFPGDLREAANNFRVGGLLWWRKVMIPGIFPYYVTGAITASGGSWNAAIVAEVASWGNTKLTAHGLGAYIAAATDRGDMARVVLGVVVMSCFVLAFNRLVWRPLYGYSERHLKLG